MPRIELTTAINANKEIIFDLSRSIYLHEISTKQSNEKAIAGVTSGLLELDQSVTWRAKHFGVYQTLTSRITEFDRPFFFVDEMVKGPFQSLRHEHHFFSSEIVTRMTDILEYTSPLGIVGEIADQLFLEKYMISLLEKRNKTIKEYAESGKWEEVL
ncbi:MAG: SRPBCC family protein [Cytophagales bacterium]|nr:SRPBCC family protein [Cytophagales bacterium]